MIAVVDASVGAKWLFPDEERSHLARELLRRSLLGDVRLHAPPLFQAEVANVVRQRMRRSDVTLERAEALLDRLLAFPISVGTPDGLIKRALRLTERFGLPAIYDAHYLALAEIAGCDVWTDDRRLLRQVSDAFPALRWIGDYRP